MDSSQQQPQNGPDAPERLPRRTPSSVGGENRPGSDGAAGGPAQPPTGGRRPSRLSVGVIIPALMGVIGVALLAWWLWSDRQASDLTPRTPVARTAADTAGQAAPADAAPETQPAEVSPATSLPAGAATPTDSGAAPTPAVASGGTPADIPGEWLGFRGANLDNISTDKTPLAKSWGADGPKVLWSVALGEGYAGPAVSKGRVYLLDYDHAAQADTMRCFSLADGKEIWKNSYSVSVKRSHGMSRTVPRISGKRVVTLGPKCHVVCWNTDSGATKWRIDLVQEYGTEVPEWYAGQCPLIDGGRVILAPGGKALFMAVDLASGKVLWQTPNPNGWRMSHSSICPVTFKGKKMYVCCFKEGVAAVSTSDGSLLWDTTEWKVSTANIPMPVPVAEGRLFLSGGYNAGSAMLELKAEGGKVRPQIEYRLKPNVFSSHQHTPIFYGGRIYGIIQSGQLVCLDPSGKQVWTSGSQHRFGLGPYLLAQGMFYVLSDDGVLSLVDASPSGYKQLAQAKVLDGPEVFGAMALVGGRLLARGMTKMVCLDVSG